MDTKRIYSTNFLKARAVITGRDTSQTYGVAGSPHREAASERRGKGRMPCIPFSAHDVDSQAAPPAPQWDA